MTYTEDTEEPPGGLDCDSGAPGFIEPRGGEPRGIVDPELSRARGKVWGEFVE